MKIISFILTLIIILFVVIYGDIEFHNGVASQIARTLLNLILLSIFIFYLFAYLYFCNLTYKTGSKLRDIVSGLIIPVWITGYNFKAIASSSELSILAILFCLMFVLFGENIYKYYFGKILQMEMENRKSSLPIKIPSVPTDMLRYHIIMVAFLVMPVLTIH